MNRGARDYGLAVEALLYLALARWAVALLPFRWIVRWMCAGGGNPRSLDDSASVILAVERAARRAPWRAVCIHQGIAAQRMLRRRGFDSRFIYGLSTAPGQLEAHVWLELDEAVVIGGDIDGDFCPVACFPESPAGNLAQSRPLRGGRPA